MDRSQIKQMIETYPEDGKLPCAVAHYIADSLGLSPRAVGEVADEIKASFSMCQLGAFGYGRKGQSCYKLFGRPVEVPQEVLERIRAKASDGKVGCQDLWEIADSCGVTRVEAGNAADSLDLKITMCQIGAFGS